MTSHPTDSSQPLTPLLEERWSPRSFDEEFEISNEQLDAILEAARWAPSASNHQPRAYIVGRRGTDTFRRINAHLMGFNRAWAFRAAALLVAIAEHSDPDGTPRRWAEYDLGLAVGAATVQAHAAGLHVHQMGGFDVDELRRDFSVPDRMLPVVIAAIGRRARPEQLDEGLAARERAPRTRRPLAEAVLVRE